MTFLVQLDIINMFWVIGEKVVSIKQTPDQGEKRIE